MFMIIKRNYMMTFLNAVKSLFVASSPPLIKIDSNISKKRQQKKRKTKATVKKKNKTIKVNKDKALTIRENNNELEKHLDSFPVEIIKGEKHLEVLGLFSPSTKRNKRKDKLTRSKVKVFERNGKKVRISIAFMGVERYGLPIILDMDIYRAFQKIVTDRFEETGVIENPITFTTADIRRAAGKTHGSRIAKGIKNWLKIMATTAIEAEQTVWYSGKKQWLEGVFHVFDNVIAIGEKLDDDVIADKHHVWLPDWHLQNFNLKQWKFIDHELHRNLKRPTSKVLYPILDNMFYASGGKKVSKNYEDLCEELDLKCHQYKSDIKRQLQPIFHDLRGDNKKGEKRCKDLEFLQKWEIKKKADGKGFKIDFWPGDRYFVLRKQRRGEQKSEEVLEPVSQDAALPQPKIDESEKEQAVALVKEFQRRKNDREDYRPTRKELQHAQDIITNHGSQKSSSILNFALGKMEETKFEAKYFGAVVGYVDEALQIIQQREENEKREIDRKAQQAQEEKSKEEYNLFVSSKRKEFEQTNADESKQLMEQAQNNVLKNPALSIIIKGKNTKSPMVQNIIKGEYRRLLCQRLDLPATFDQWKQSQAQNTK